MGDGIGAGKNFACGEPLMGSASITQSHFWSFVENEELSRLQCMALRVDEHTPGAEQAFRVELARINAGAVSSERQNIYDKIKTSPLASLIREEEGVGNGPFLEMNNPFAVGKNKSAQDNSQLQPSKSLFASPGDSLMSITDGAAEAFNSRDAFSEALVSLAGHNQIAIANMIRDNGNETCTITFPGAPNEPIDVPVPDDNSTKYAPALGNYWRGTWPKAMQDAFAVYMRKHPEAKNDAETTLHLLTGLKVESDTLRVFNLPTETRGTLDATLRSAEENGMPSIAYDRERHFYRGIWNYDSKNREVTWAYIMAMRTKLSADTIMPYFGIAVRHGFDWDKVYYTVPDKTAR